MNDTSSDKSKSSAEIDANRHSTNEQLGQRKTPYERRNLRHVAELKLTQMNAIKTKTTDMAIGEPFDNLLHELQVHQIELEMQNEELRCAHVALEESRDQYLSLFEFAPVGYLTLSAEGLITEINFTAEKLLGIDRKKLLSRPLSKYLTPDSANDFHLCLVHLMQQDTKQCTDLKIKREDNASCYVHMDAMRVQSELGEVALRVTLTDITKLKLTKQELRIAATAFEVQEGIMVTDIHNVIIRTNKAFTRLTGFSAEEAKGKNVSFLKSGRHDTDFYKNMWQAINQNHFWQGEIWDKRKNGEIFPVLMTITAVFGEDGHPSHYVGSFSDITLQKQAEKLLLDERQRLEKQVGKSVEELNRLKEEGSDVHTALKVMIKLRESESAEAKNLLILELKHEVMPFLQRLKLSSRDPKQVRLLSALDANMQRLISTYGCATSISSAYKNLTPKEIQVASMVREGASTKVIASTLSLSPETISIHRKNIRKKLGLDSKSDNLRSHLITLDK